MEDNPLLAAALDYAGRGFQVIPLNGKLPRTAHGLKDASTDPEQIWAWWRQWPTADVGIVTGETSGIVVLDVDGEAGEASLAALEARFGPCPPTLEVRTGGGGRHIYFRHPGGGRRLGNKQSIAPKLDVRGDAGYIVAPPSGHKSGNRYTWLTELPPADPAWFLRVYDTLDQETREAKSRKQAGRGVPALPPASRTPDHEHTRRRARSYLRKMEPAIQGSNGSGALFNATLAMVRGFDLPPAEALELLRSDFNPRCVPEWSEPELAHKVADAASSEQVPAGYLLDAEPPARIERSRLAASAVPEPPAWMDEIPPCDYEAPPPAGEEQPGIYLDRDKKGRVIKTAANLIAILRHDPGAPQVRLNEFGHVIELPAGEGKPPRAMADADIVATISWIETEHHVSWGVDLVDRCIALVAEERSFNPLQDYLGGLVHDGTPRLATWLIEAAGTRDTPTVRAYSRRWLIGAVARAMNPGCKLDTALVLVGAQGEGKSTLFKVLAGEEFFVDSPIEIGQKDAYLTIDRAWIYEFSELASLSRKEVRAVKGFLTSTHDEFRPPYGRRNVRLGRHCAFCGTTNDLECLHDATGDRRFWPVTVGKVDLGWIRANRDQLWAEAVACWRAGEQWWLTPEEQTASEQHSDAFRELDSWTPLVEEILDALPEPKGIQLCDLAQLLRDGSRRETERGASPPEIARDGRETDQRLRNILKRLGWSTGGKPSWDPTTKKVARLWRPDPTLRPYACLTVADEGTVRSDSPKESSVSASTLHPYAENIGKTTVDVGRDAVEGVCRGCSGESMYVPQRKVLGSPDSEVRSTPSDLTPPIANRRKVALESPETPLFDPVDAEWFDAQFAAAADDDLVEVLI